ncbi:hypothetical protein [Maritalea porphyrae]|uniref:hypothetical protein n=1 Tax=Maritalea porphyrae TaxID=880732 RepID=UPI0022AEC9E0|nr:hypothetical protein [Maritalea porphyrae]MCZ4274027.1 hypothetical protein [Maritalea porphyrae]
MANTVYTAQWFGCRHCDVMWLGGTLPMSTDQTAAMKHANRTCPGCSRPTQFHGGRAQFTATYTYSGPASDILHLFERKVA